MLKHTEFYIDGTWVAPVTPQPFDVINPATEESCATISLGSSADVDKAVAAARRAFGAFAATSREDRLELLANVEAVYQRRYNEVAEAISTEMGAPMWLAMMAQARTGMNHIQETRRILKDYAFEQPCGDNATVRREAFGVCGFITPWNWPMNQITCKVIPALAAGCTMVLKPSEIAPLSGMLLAEILDEAGVPKGVFNLVNGDGPGVGAAISSHADIDLVSFTGSTRAGIAVAKAAADTVKKVTQELGGKSANIILHDANLQLAVSSGVNACFMNSGQTCSAPTRMFVPQELHDEAVEIARKTAKETAINNPKSDGMFIGPVVSEAQFDKIQELIETGVAEGAMLVAGGPGRPEGFNRGYYVRPTVFANVSNDMTIAREEIFGPVLVMLPYDSEDEAVAMANDTPYGLSGYVQGEPAHARKIANRMRTGMVHINGAQLDPRAPFGGYKQSGNGREWGELGFEEFLEVKAIMATG